MKLDLKSIIVILLIGFITWQNFFATDDIDYKEPEKVVIKTPEVKGITGDTIEVVTIDTLYLPSEKEYIRVDAGWKDKYNTAMDSLEKQRLFYEAIKIRNYEKVLVDNDTIHIKGFATTRGSLLSYSVDYSFKPRDFSYTPEQIIRRPRLSMGLGFEVGLPTGPIQDFRVKGNLRFENRKGGGFSIGADTSKTIWLGLSKTFKLKD